MSKLQKTATFVKRGFATFHDASRGCYKQNTDAVSEIRKEILSENRGSDKMNLLKDRKNIEGDMRKAFDKIVLTNG